MYLANLYFERARAGYSQVELSKRAGVSRDAISKFERLRRQAQPATVRRLSEALEVSPEDLYGTQPDPAPPVLTELREALEAAGTRGGREEQIAELERYLQRDPNRLRTWLYEVSIEELMARESLSRRDYSAAATGAGRASAKALEIYPLLVLSLLELVQDLLSRDPALQAPVQTTEAAENAPEPSPASRPRQSTETRMAAEPDEED